MVPPPRPPRKPKVSDARKTKRALKRSKLVLPRPDYRFAQKHSEEWESTLERDERRYRELQETIFGSESANPSSSVGGELAMKAVNPGEHPLAAEPASGSWERYMRSQRAEEQITRDVERLHPDNPLFRGSCAENAHKVVKRSTLSPSLDARMS